MLVWLPLQQHRPLELYYILPCLLTDIHVHLFLHIPSSIFHTTTMWSSNFQAGCCTSMLFVSHILTKTAMPYQYSITLHTVFHTCFVVLTFQQFKNKINTKHVILFFNTHHLMHNWCFLTPPSTSPAQPCAHPETVRRPVFFHSIFLVPTGFPLPVTLPTNLNYRHPNHFNPDDGGSMSLQSPISSCAIISELPQRSKSAIPCPLQF